jgi:histidinol-phosphate aminotransferase
MAGIEPQPGIMDIALYVGGDSHVAGKSNVVKLSSNENPHGPSDAARDAFSMAVHELHRYPPTDHARLRAAIGEVHGLDPERIFCGVGSGEVLKLLSEAYAGPGTEVLFTEHGFSMYPIYAKSCGATAVVVPERERVVDVDAVLAAVTDQTRLVLIANPGNPTGTMLGPKALRQLAEDMPKHALLVLDGAYAEYVDAYDGGAALVDEHDNVVMTRTFSKIYGLGGLRVGWGYAKPEVIGVLNRIRGPFNLSTAALLGAEAAVRDRAHVAKCKADNAKWRDWLARTLAEIGVPSDTSTANFILARFADQDEAEACDAYLRSEGILVRRVAGYGLPHCLRITVGDESGCRRVAHAIGQFKGVR